MIAGAGGGAGGPNGAAAVADRAEDDSFIKEFEHLKTLRHPNVVQFFGAACSSNLETAEQRRVLVMELAACSLKDVVRGEHVPEGGYPVVTSLNWARQVAAGLRYIHDRRIIHFDIKVRNSLLAGTCRRSLLKCWGPKCAMFRVSDRPPLHQKRTR
jgi:serine/threonine protein kinase